MTLLDTLLDIYGYNEPIFGTEIQFEGYSRPWICKELKRLCDDGKLNRFAQGIYYIPLETPLGKSLLDPGKVIEKKYISDGKSVMGYYSGAALLNKLGLSTQMPNILEIYTNNESSKIREVSVGWQKVILRRSRIAITSENVSTQILLELLNTVPTSYFTEARKKSIARFIQDNDITREKVTTISPSFPDRAMRTAVESEVIYSVTS